MYPVDYLSPKKSRLKLLDYKVTCVLCEHDVFIPHEVYIDVEQPGIQLFYPHYIAICQNCGEVKQFGNSNDYDTQTNQWIWILHQEIL